VIRANAPPAAAAANVRLTGRTTCGFSSTFRLANEAIGPGAGCDGCSGADCVRVTGTLEARYSVTTTVTLPNASDFRGLTRCQRRRVQDAIDDILAPQEQEHVAAFETYEGRTSTPVDITLCRGAGFRRRLEARLQDLHDAEEGPRQTAAQSLSDALDPFHVDVDLNCED
jgi:hypothetical protein